MKQPIRKYFAVNLRRECEKFESISGVCKAIQVNRQQFNKYLAGSHIPQGKTRRRICEFLGVTEEEMFWPPSQTTAQAQSIKEFVLVKPDVLVPAFNTILRYLENSVGTRQKAKAQDLKDGFYFCYFPMQRHSSILVRAIVRVSSKTGIKTFVRHTFFRSGTLPTRTIARGRHVGVVTSNETETCLLGVNFSLPHHLSVLTFAKQQASGDNVLFGIGLSRGITTPFGSRVCLEFLGSAFGPVKHLLKCAGVVQNTSSTIHPSIALYFKSGGPNEVGQLDMPNLEEMLAAASRVDAASNDFALELSRS